MVPINGLYFRLRTYSLKHKPLYLFSLVIFFYAIFDGIFTYVFPLAIEQNGFSKTMMGIIIGSSSVVGAFFDFIISKYIRNTHFRRMYFLMFAFCFLAPIILWSAKPLWIFLLASALWGIYYDLYSFGKFDFVSRATTKEEHSSGFGMLSIFSSLGYMIAPILAGLAIGEIVDWKPYSLMYGMLIISFLFFCILVYLHRKKEGQSPTSEVHKPINFLKEIGIWEKIGKLIFPLLILTTLLSTFDAFFWTIGPLISENYKNLHPFNGLFLTLYTLPSLLIGWFVGGITLRFGKKRAAFLSFILGSLILSLFPFVTNTFLILALVFFSSCFISIAWPSINGAYADYISETKQYSGEIEALNDTFTNLGYIIGPISAGFLADQLGNQNAFTVLGIAGAITAFFLWQKTPKEITIKV